jgi:uncharacterized protein (TIGR00725 family)
MRRLIGVIGAGECDARVAALAHEVGRRLAEAGCTLVGGGLGGVTEAAARGAREAGGLVVGILPGPDPSAANPHVEIAIATGMGEVRNAVIVNSAHAFVAIARGYGTLSEIAFALRQGKRVVGLESWEVDDKILRAETPDEAVRLVLAS